MAKKKMGLGRGLDSLFSESSELDDELRKISIGDIDRNPDQPRQTFDEESLQALAQSIRDQGVLQPLLVVPGDGDRYTLVAGERRWRAARIAGLDTVPCIVRDMDVIRQMEIALIENLQREDLNPMEEAAGIQSLMRQCGYTQEAAAARVGRSRPAVANLLRLLTLPEEVQEMVRTGSLSAGHARVLAGLPDDPIKLRLAHTAVDNGLSVRELEKLAAHLTEEAPPAAPHKSRLSVELQDFENRIRETMGVQATLKGTGKKGRIVLSYSSRDELEHLYELISRLGE